MAQLRTVRFGRYESSVAHRSNACKMAANNAFTCRPPYGASGRCIAWRLLHTTRSAGKHILVPAVAPQRMVTRLWFLTCLTLWPCQTRNLPRLRKTSVSVSTPGALRVGFGGGGGGGSILHRNQSVFKFDHRTCYRFIFATRVIAACCASEVPCSAPHACGIPTAFGRRR